MPKLKITSTDRITICGLPGTGKTTLSKYLALLAEPNILVYDPLDQYTELDDRCRYVPKSDSPLEFDRVCKVLCARSDTLFIVEECERYLGQGKALGPYAFEVINRGRNWGIGVIAVTRRLQRLSKDYFDLCQRVFFFRCGLKSRQYIEDMLGKSVLGQVIALERFHFLCWDVEEESGVVAKLSLGTVPRVEGV